MADEWPEAVLGDVVDRITVGHVGPMADRYVEQGIPFLRSQDVQPFRLDFAETKHIGEDFHRELAKSALAPGDVVIVRTGKPGAAAVVPPTLQRANCADLVIVRPGPRVDSRWLAYYINVAAGHYVASRLVGAVQQHFNVGSARELRLPLPSLGEQRAVAGVLGALDDKIESNSRLIGLLESTFFLECEALLAGDSAPSDLRLGDVAEISLGGTPSRDRAEYWTAGTIPWINSGCLHQRPVLDPADFITDMGLRQSATKYLSSGTTLVAITGATLGVTSRLAIDAAVNQSVVGISAPRNRTLNDYLYFAVRFNMEALMSAATGAAQQHVNKSNFENLVVQMPSPPVLADVSALGPLLDRQAEVARESKTLAALRDALLPELLSGRLRVREAERVIEDVV